MINSRPKAAGKGTGSSRRRPEHKLTYALLLSSVIHALVLCLTFGGDGWLPGFSFPWQVRRSAVPELRVLIVPARITAREPPASAQAPTPTVSDASVRERLPTKEAQIKRTDEAAPEAAVIPTKDLAAIPARAESQSRAQTRGDSPPPPTPVPDVIALPRQDETTWVIPPPTENPTPVIAAAPSALSPQAVTPAAPDPGDAARIESARLADERAEAARMEDARLRAERQESARAEAARAEAARLQAERAEAARLQAEREASARGESARAEAARAEAARAEAARAEAAARAESARAEAARAEAARAEAARLQAEREAAARMKAEQEQAAAKREERLRALGRELDEAATRRDAAREARAAVSQAPSHKPLRRYRLLGRTDSNAEIIQYAEAFSRKIQLNMTIEMVREAAKERHNDPLVTVAIRSDGSVESLTFIRSSGVAAIDEAIRRIVASQEPYPTFPPALAREYDVIEIRRSWHFDVAVRLY